MTRCLTMAMAMAQKDHDNAKGWRATRRNLALCGPKRNLAERFVMTRDNEGNGDDSNGYAGGGKKEDADAGGDGTHEESRVARISTSAMVTTMTMKTMLMMLMMLMMMMMMMTIMSFMAIATIAMITAKMPALTLKKTIDMAIVRMMAMTVGAMTTAMRDMMMMVVTVVMI